jgi:hypothetical protein
MRRWDKERGDNEEEGVTKMNVEIKRGGGENAK